MRIQFELRFIVGWQTRNWSFDLAPFEPWHVYRGLSYLDTPEWQVGPLLAIRKRGCEATTATA